MKKYTMKKSLVALVLCLCAFAFVGKAHGAALDQYSFNFQDVIGSFGADSVVNISPQFSEPYILQLQGGDVVYVNDVGVFDHPAVSGGENFSSSPSTLKISGVSSNLHAQDYFVIPGHVYNPNQFSTSCPYFIIAQNLEEALSMPFEPLGQVLSNKIKYEISKWLLGFCMPQSAQKVAELSLADIRMEGNKVVNDANWDDSPYEGGGAPIAFTAHDATPVFANGKFSGVVALFYMPQPEATAVVPDDNPLKPHLAFYKPDENGVLKLSTFISPISSSAFAFNKLISCTFLNAEVNAYLEPSQMLGDDLSGCMPEIFPADIAAVDFNGDGVDDVVTVNRGSFSRALGGVQTTYSFANVYLGTNFEDPKVAFKYAGQIFIGNEPYQVVPTLDKRSVLVSTLDGIYKISYPNGNLSSDKIINNSIKTAGFRMHHVAEVENGTQCKAIAYTWSKASFGSEPSITFEKSFTYHNGYLSNGACKYDKFKWYQLPADPNDQDNPPLAATIMFAPAIEGRSAASLWVGDQRVRSGVASAYRYQIGSDGFPDEFSRTKYNVSGELAYQDDSNYPKDNKGKCGVKQQRADKYGNIISVIGCPAVFMKDAVFFGEPGTKEETCPVPGHPEKCYNQTTYPPFGSFGEVTTMINKVPECSCENYKEFGHCPERLFNETVCGPAQPTQKCNCDNYQANTRLCGAFDASTCPKRLPPCTCDMRLIDPNKCDVTPLGEYNSVLKKYAACTTLQVSCNCDTYKDTRGCEAFNSSVCVEIELPACTCETVNYATPCDPTNLGPKDPVTGAYSSCTGEPPVPCSCTNYVNRTDCPSDQFNPTVCGAVPVDCTCADYLARGSECPNPQDFFDTNGNGVADKCETVSGTSGDCVMLVGKNGMPAVGDWAVGTDYDNYIRLLNRKSSEIYCNEVKKRGGTCDPDKNPHDIFVGELGVFTFKCVQPAAKTFGMWQVSGYPLGPDFYGEDGFRAGQLPEEIDLPDGNKMSRKTYLTNTATRLFAVSGTSSAASAGKALLASNVAVDFMPDIVKAAKKEFVNLTLDRSLSPANGGFSVSIGKSADNPYMTVKVKQVDTIAASKALKALTSGTTGMSSASTNASVVEVTGRAGLDVGQFYAPPAQASTSRNLDPNQFLDAFAEALAKQPASVKTPNFSKAVKDANEIYPWDEYMHVSNAIGSNTASYNIMPLYYVGATGGGKSGFGCSLIR